MQRNSYIPALDGIRVIAVALVMYFHFWQQNWLQPAILNIKFITVDMYPLASAGFLGVELLFVLSGFLLYWPIAHQNTLHIRDFYTKRAVRIIPSYWLCVIVCALFAIGKFASLGSWASYTLQNMAFMNMFRRELIFNELNSVLWSMSVEVWFYIVFPMVAWLFRKKPALVTLACFVLAWGYRSWVLASHRYEMILYMNQLPGMLDCFVGGMFAAHLASHLAGQEGQKTKSIGWGGVSLLGLAGLWFFLWLLNYSRGSAEGIQYYQVICRSAIVMSCMAAVIGAALAGEWFQMIMGNRIVRFVSLISYNLYLWHQWLAVKLKEWRVPNWRGLVATDDRAWQWQHMLLSIVLSVSVAAIITLLFDKPFTTWLRKHLIPQRKRID